MDKLAAVRAGLIHTEHRQEADHRVPCSLCGFPCEPDQLTEVFGSRLICPTCFADTGWYMMSHEEYFKCLRKLEDQKNAENFSGTIRG